MKVLGTALIGLVAYALLPGSEKPVMPLAVAPAHAQTAAAPRGAFIPTGWVATGGRSVQVDGRPATLLRHVRADGRDAAVGGEHVSTLVSADGRLKGFTRMQRELATGALPSEENARAIAMAFLGRAAPDLLSSHRVSWIRPHDEVIRVTTADGAARDLTLTGMKVKMRSTADGLWFWVIVGSDREVMVFERDIVWSTFAGGRQTEKWLHDAWLLENGHAGPAT